jgi:hypothetical protein
MNKLNFFMLHPNAEIVNPDGHLQKNILKHLQYYVGEFPENPDIKIKLRKPESLTETELSLINSKMNTYIFESLKKIEMVDLEPLKFYYNGTNIYGEPLTSTHTIEWLPKGVADYLRSIGIFIDYHLGEEFIENNIEWEK